ncbi:uncharacterized protein EAF01_006259 [Botrytis porri]|uniref:uncharacterized protein n=1 Tax=Botrytis porri TaxID=87229 RepID=UPI001900E2ED|nr:uncharacterized protein EAF01_006259 [Botrytis porri]KAF7903210.1 hypothetical protein EAF01_006259 [Botrytis porri]
MTDTISSNTKYPAWQSIQTPTKKSEAKSLKPATNVEKEKLGALETSLAPIAFMIRRIVLTRTIMLVAVELKSFQIQITNPTLNTKSSLVDLT